MKTNNKIIFLLTIILIISLSSCDFGSNKGIGTVFEGGTQALLFRFVEGTPPTFVYDNNAMPFDILLSVENAGEFDTDSIYFTISGISPNDFPGTYLGAEGKTRGWITTGVGKELGTEVLAGKTKLEKTVLPGDNVFLTIGSGIYYNKPLLGGGEMPYTIMIDACYPYATVATSSVCYQRNYNDGDDTACNPRTGGQMSVSSAPLQITSFTQTPVGPTNLRIQYKFELRGNVKIWAPIEPTVSRWQNCAPSTRTDRVKQEGVFYVKVDHQGIATEMRCIELQQNADFNGEHITEIPQPTLTPLTSNAIRISEVTTRTGGTGYLKLQDGKATLTCTLTLPEATTNHIGTINVASTYYIQDSVRTMISVTHSGQ